MSSDKSEKIIRFRAGRHRWRVLVSERQYLFSREKVGQIRQSPMTRIKQSRAKVVYRMKMGGPNGQRAIYLKSYLIRNYFWRPFKYLFRTSPAMMEWRLAQELVKRDVPIARHLAVGETRYRGFLLEATLVTEGLVDFEDIEDFFQKQYDSRVSDVPAHLRRSFARELGKFLRLVHDRGVLQVDLHPANIMVRVGENGLQSLPICVDVAQNQVAHSRIRLTSGGAPRRSGMATVPIPRLTYKRESPWRYVPWI